MSLVVFTGDWHLGAGDTQPSEIEEIALRYWKNKQVILMGDLIDCGLEQGMQFENAIQPQEQVKQVQNICKHLNVVAYCLGNHENRIFKHTGLNVYELFLGEPSHRISIDNIEVYFAHGRSSAGDMWREAKNLMSHIDADVIALAHNHQLAKLDVLRERLYYISSIKSLRTLRRVTLLRTGALAKGLKYAAEWLLPQNLRGWVEYDTDKRMARLYALSDINSYNVIEI